MTEKAAALDRAARWNLGLAIATTLLAGLLAHLHRSPVLTFVVAAAALSLLAAMVGQGTEQVGRRLGPGATGVLQSALGNLPELFVALFALRAGLHDVVHAALIGSILANSLLVLGLALLVGGLRHGTQRFGHRTPRMVSVLLLLAISATVIPTLAHELHTPANAHEPALAAVVSVLLLVVFACSLPFSIRGDPTVVLPPDPESRGEAWPMWISITVLAAAAGAAAYVSAVFVDALTPTIRALGISETFAGLVIVAIAGNAVENVVAIRLMARNKPDYALSVVLNSSLQIALVLTPVLVLASFFVGASPMTLVVSPLLAASLLLTTLIITVIVVDGESIWLEGVALIGLYGIIAASVWWG